MDKRNIGLVLIIISVVLGIIAIGFDVFVAADRLDAEVENKFLEFKFLKIYVYLTNSRVKLQIRLKYCHLSGDEKMSNWNL